MTKQDDILVYSTMAGDLPKMVEQGIPKCFIEWSVYLELKKENEKLLVEIEDLEYDKIGC